MERSEYYEDLKLGDKRRSRAYHLTEQEIIAIARQWDPQPIHIDPEFAAKTPIGSVFACSAQLIGIMTKLLHEIWGKLATIAGLGWDEVRFVSPGLPRADIHVETVVLSKRESASNPNVGILTCDIRLVNQKSEPVLTLKGIVLVEKRLKR